MKALASKIYRKTAFPHIMGLLVLITLFFLFLENRFPFYSFRNINGDFYFPILGHFYTGLTKEFELATYDFFQLLGFSPLTLPGLMYPLTHVSFWLSKLMAGDFFWSIDIFVLLHQLIGALGVFALLREYGLRHRTSFIGALFWGLNIFVIARSSDFFYFSAAGAYLPWIQCFLSKTLKKVHLGHLSLLVVFRVLLYYSAGPEYFFFEMALEIVYMIFFYAKFGELFQRKSFTFRENSIWLKGLIVNDYYPLIRQYVLGLFASLIFVLPVLLPLISNGSSFPPQAGEIRHSVIAFLIGILYPVSSESLQKFNLSLGENPLIWHVGYVVLIGLSLLFIKKLSKNGFAKYLKPIFVLFLISFAFSFGLLCPLLRCIGQKNGFDAGIYVVFYLTLLSAIGLENLWEFLSERLKILAFSLIVVFFIFNVLVIHFNKSFEPSPCLPYQSLSDSFINARFIVISDENESCDRMHLMPSNVSTYWKMHNYGGSLLNKLHKKSEEFEFLSDSGFLNADLNSQLISRLRNRGVKYYLVSNSSLKNVLPALKKTFMSRIYTNDLLSVFIDNEALPLAFWKETQTRDFIELNTHSDYLEITTFRAKEGELVLNFGFNKYLKVFLDGYMVEKIGKNLSGQFYFDVPQGYHKITLRYQNTYYLWGVRICVLFLIVLIFWGFMSKKWTINFKN
jgi:hypothetical protein